LGVRFIAGSLADGRETREILESARSALMSKIYVSGQPQQTERGRPVPVGLNGKPLI
jgi:hypothetical protein